MSRPFLYLTFLSALLLSRDLIGKGWVLLCLLAVFYNLLEWRGRARPLPSGPLTLLSLLAIGYGLLGVLRGGSVEAFLTPLLALSAVRFLGPCRVREMWQIYALSFLILCAVSVVKLSLEFGVALGAFTLFAVCGLILLNWEREGAKGPLEKVLLYSLGLGSGILLLAVLFFVFLPRSPFAFLTLPFLGEGGTRAGFSEVISLGDVGEVIEDRRVAFRVILPKGLLPGPLYWRGAVYTTYRKGRWIREGGSPPPLRPFPARGIEQTVLLEPYEGDVLFGLDCPRLMEVIAPKGRGIRVFPGWTFRIRPSSGMRVKYRVLSLPSPPRDPPGEECLQVPSSLRARLQRIALEVIGERDKGDALEIAQRLSSFLNSPPFGYALNVPPPGDRDPVIHFLLSSHRGWCEHFASALALLLRSVGIPARVVGGYRGGEWNGLGHYYIVRQKDAHTWVEVWCRGRWERVDPTPSVQRKRTSFPLARFVDYLRLRWFLYVINYDFAAQQRFFQGIRDEALRLSWRMPHLPPLKVGRVGIYLLVGILGSLLLLRAKGRRLTQYERLKRILAKRWGLGLEPWQGGKELLRLCTQRDQEVGKLVEDFISVWYRTRYGRMGMMKEERAHLERLLREIARIVKRSGKGGKDVKGS